MTEHRSGSAATAAAAQRTCSRALIMLNAPKLQIVANGNAGSIAFLSPQNVLRKEKGSAGREKEKEERKTQVNEN